MLLGGLRSVVPCAVMILPMSFMMGWVVMRNAFFACGGASLVLRAANAGTDILLGCRRAPQTISYGIFVKNLFLVLCCFEEFEPEYIYTMIIRIKRYSSFIRMSFNHKFYISCVQPMELCKNLA